MPVYADILFVTNSFVNYLILLCTMKILGYKTGRLRLLLGSFSGGLFALKIFLPEMHIIFELIFRIAIPAVTVVISFTFRSFASFIKGYFTFLSINFCFSGVIIAIIYFINPPRLIYSNGAVYYDIGFINTTVLCLFAFMVITATEKILKRKSEIQKIYEITVFSQNKKVTGRALADSGNCLRDVFTQRPVIVADYASVKNISPEGVEEYLNSKNIEIHNKLIKVIPVSTVSGTGLLPVFKADKVIIKGINKTNEINDVYIAVSKEKLCHGEFEFLLNNEIPEGNGNEKNYSINKRAIK